MSKTLYLVSLGCTKNLVDSEVMLGKLSQYRLVSDASSADVIIVNSCGFIEAAKEESLSTIFELNRQRKRDSLLVVSGCLSQRYQEELKSQMPEIDILTGVGDYERIDELISLKKSSFSPEVYLIDENSPRVITGSNYHTYIKISEGCNQNCSFCAIPTFKGRLKSRSVESIVQEVINLTKKGFCDFSFISQDSSSYGRDLGLKDGLIELIENIELIPSVKSCRILYLYPTTTSRALIDAIENSRVFQTYYDIPIQHIDDEVLKSMKRGFGESETIKLLQRVREKEGSFLRTSIIVGHPGETQESFDRLCRFLREFEFDRINVFSYSNEESTKAYSMPQLLKETIESRTDVIAQIAKEAREKSLKKMVGKSVTVVVDGESEEHKLLLSSRPLLWAVDIDGEILINDTEGLKVEIGKCYRARVTEFVGEYLMGTIFEEVY
jgi:ribosomal protein S12 methylthiotransferase RimO